MKLRAPILLLLTSTWLGACGGGGGGGDGATPPTAPPPPGNPSLVTVELREHAFDPRSVTIEPGQTVRWVLRGQDATHTVTALDGTFDSGFTFEDSGDAFEHRFSAADDGRTFEYSCVSHAGCCDMKGSIRVGASAPPPDPGYG